MTLQELFDQFSYGELSQLSIGGQPAGTINYLNWANLIPHINLGLTTLYKRFELKKSELLVQLVAGRTSYRLHSDFSILSFRGGSSVVRYIVDTRAARFADDILKIEQVLTDDGVAFKLNDANDEFSLSTTSMTTLALPQTVADQSSEIPVDLLTENLKVVYRADHPKLIMRDDLDPERTYLELPYSHLEALLWFVASRIHNPIGMGQEFNAGNTYYAKFEAECQRLQNEGLEIDQGAQSTRLSQKGWV
jgi:hypothetical protein